MGKTTTSTIKKTATKRVAKPASAANETVEASLPTGAEKPVPKAKRARKTAPLKPARPARVKRPATAKQTSRKASSAAAASAYTSEDIALRAYFISQKRHQRGQFGSPESDWLEAERQLREGLRV